MEHFCPGDIWQYLEILLFVTPEDMATGICRAEVKSAAMHPTMHKAAYHTKDYLVPNVNNADCEKPCCKVKRYNA